MNAWLILFLVTLGRCSEELDRSEEFTLPNGYPFRMEIKIPELNGFASVLNRQEVPFVTNLKMIHRGMRVSGIPIQDENETIHFKIQSSRGNTSTIAFRFVILERDETDQGCGLYPAAVIEFGKHASYAHNRSRLFETLEELSKRLGYPMKLMKVHQPLNQEKDWRLHLMAPKNCSGETLEINVWKTINRIVGQIQDGMRSIDGVPLKSQTTKEFTENFKTAPRRLDPNDGIDRGIVFPGNSIEGRTLEALTTAAAATIVVTTTTDSPTTTSTTTEPTTTSTTTEPTTTSTTTELITTSTTTEPTTTSTTSRPTTTTIASSTAQAEKIIPNHKEAPLHITTEIPAPTDEDVETVGRVDEYYPEALPKQNTGASVAMPLFTVIVLLALASAAAVFTIARARNIHRKTFVIGNASPEEINDIVVLGRDDGFH